MIKQDTGTFSGKITVTKAEDGEILSILRQELPSFQSVRALRKW